MKYYNQEMFLGNEKTRLTEYLDKVFEGIDKILIDTESKIKEGTPEDVKTEHLASQIIASSFFQFEANDVPHNVVAVICHSYMSPEYTPFTVLKDYLYTQDGQTVNPEKIFAIREALNKYYMAFYNEYDKTNNPEIMNGVLYNFSLDLKTIKNHIEEKEQEKKAD